MRQDESLVSASVDFLEKNQNADGGWSSQPGAGQSDWCSAPVVLCMRVLSKEPAAGKSAGKIDKCIKKAFENLVESRTELYEGVRKIVMFTIFGPDSQDYARGWPWTHGTFHWVEPTSYSLMAIKIPAVPENAEFKKVVAKANQFLTEHSCKGGGWNHGNNLCLGVDLPPYVVTTAEALLALQDSKDVPEVKNALTFLAGRHETEPTPMALAWSILAQDAHGKDCTTLLNQLIAMQNKDGSFGPNLMVTSIAALALEVALGTNALKFA